MSLRTGERVPVSIEQADRENTAALNEKGIYGRSQALQTNLFVYSFEWGGGAAVQTYTLPQNVILTGIYLTADGVANSGTQTAAAYHTAFDSDNLIGSIKAITDVGLPKTEQTYIPIPNWNLPAGSDIIGYGLGGEHSVVVFIGYLV